jgi:hypothetical protein
VLGVSLSKILHINICLRRKCKEKKRQVSRNVEWKSLLIFALQRRLNQALGVLAVGVKTTVRRERRLSLLVFKSSGAGPKAWEGPTWRNPAQGN